VKRGGREEGRKGVRGKILWENGYPDSNGPKKSSWGITLNRFNMGGKTLEKKAKGEDKTVGKQKKTRKKKVGQDGGKKVKNLEETGRVASKTHHTEFRALIESQTLKTKRKNKI